MAKVEREEMMPKERYILCLEANTLFHEAKAREELTRKAREKEKENRCLEANTPFHEAKERAEARKAKEREKERDTQWRGVHILSHKAKGKEALRRRQHQRT
jgi:hypothetical protein